MRNIGPYFDSEELPKLNVIPTKKIFGESLDVVGSHKRRLMFTFLNNEFSIISFEPITIEEGVNWYADCNIMDSEVLFPLPYTSTSFWRKEHKILSYKTRPFSKREPWFLSWCTSTRTEMVTEARIIAEGKDLNWKSVIGKMFIDNNPLVPIPESHLTQNAIDTLFDYITDQMGMSDQPFIKSLYRYEVDRLSNFKKNMEWFITFNKLINDGKCGPFCILIDNRTMKPYEFIDPLTKLIEEDQIRVFNTFLLLSHFKLNENGNFLYLLKEVSEKPSIPLGYASWSYNNVKGKVMHQSIEKGSSDYSVLSVYKVNDTWMVPSTVIVLPTHLLENSNERPLIDYPYTIPEVYNYSRLLDYYVTNDSKYNPGYRGTKKHGFTGLRYFIEIYNPKTKRWEVLTSEEPKLEIRKMVEGGISIPSNNKRNDTSETRKKFVEVKTKITTPTTIGIDSKDSTSQDSSLLVNQDNQPFFKGMIIKHQNQIGIIKSRSDNINEVFLLKDASGKILPTEKTLSISANEEVEPIKDIDELVRDIAKHLQTDLNAVVLTKVEKEDRLGVIRFLNRDMSLIVGLKAKESIMDESMTVVPIWNYKKATKIPEWFNKINETGIYFFEKYFIQPNSVPLQGYSFISVSSTGSMEVLPLSYNATPNITREDKKHSGPFHMYNFTKLSNDNHIEELFHKLSKSLEETPVRIENENTIYNITRIDYVQQELIVTLSKGSVNRLARINEIVPLDPEYIRDNLKNKGMEEGYDTFHKLLQTKLNGSIIEKNLFCSAMNWLSENDEISIPLKKRVSEMIEFTFLEEQINGSNKLHHLVYLDSDGELRLNTTGALLLEKYKNMTVAGSLLQFTYCKENIILAGDESNQSNYLLRARDGTVENKKEEDLNNLTNKMFIDIHPGDEVVVKHDNRDIVNQNNNIGVVVQIARYDGQNNLLTFIIKTKDGKTILGNEINTFLLERKKMEIQESTIDITTLKTKNPISLKESDKYIGLDCEAMIGGKNVDVVATFLKKTKRGYGSLFCSLFITEKESKFKTKKTKIDYDLSSFQSKFITNWFYLSIHYSVKDISFNTNQKVEFNMVDHIQSSMNKELKTSGQNFDWLVPFLPFIPNDFELKFALDSIKRNSIIYVEPHGNGPIVPNSKFLQDNNKVDYAQIIDGYYLPLKKYNKSDDITQHLVVPSNDMKKLSPDVNSGGLSDYISFMKDTRFFNIIEWGYGFNKKVEYTIKGYCHCNMVSFDESFQVKIERGFYYSPNKRLISKGEKIEIFKLIPLFLDNIIQREMIAVGEIATILMRFGTNVGDIFSGTTIESIKAKLMSDKTLAQWLNKDGSHKLSDRNSNQPVKIIENNSIYIVRYEKLKKEIYLSEFDGKLVVETNNLPPLPSLNNQWAIVSVNGQEILGINKEGLFKVIFSRSNGSNWKFDPSMRRSDELSLRTITIKDDVKTFTIDEPIVAILQENLYEGKHVIGIPSSFSIKRENNTLVISMNMGNCVYNNNNNNTHDIEFYVANLNLQHKVHEIDSFLNIKKLSDELKGDYETRLKQWKNLYDYQRNNPVLLTLEDEKNKISATYYVVKKKYNEGSPLNTIGILRKDQDKQQIVFTFDLKISKYRLKFYDDPEIINDKIRQIVDDINNLTFIKKIEKESSRKDILENLSSNNVVVLKAKNGDDQQYVYYQLLSVSVSTSNYGASHPFIFTLKTLINGEIIQLLSFDINDSTVAEIDLSSTSSGSAFSTRLFMYSKWIEYFEKNGKKREIICVLQPQEESGVKNQLAFIGGIEYTKEPQSLHVKLVNVVSKISGLFSYKWIRTAAKETTLMGLVARISKISQEEKNQFENEVDSYFANNESYFKNPSLSIIIKAQKAKISLDEKSPDFRITSGNDSLSIWELLDSNKSDYVINRSGNLKKLLETSKSDFPYLFVKEPKKIGLFYVPSDFYNISVRIKMLIELDYIQFNDTKSITNILELFKGEDCVYTNVDALDLDLSHTIARDLITTFMKKLTVEKGKIEFGIVVKFKESDRIFHGVVESFTFPYANILCLEFKKNQDYGKLQFIKCRLEDIVGISNEVGQELKKIIKPEHFDKESFFATNSTTYVWPVVLNRMDLSTIHNILGTMKNYTLSLEFFDLFNNFTKYSKSNKSQIIAKKMKSVRDATVISHPNLQYFALWNKEGKFWSHTASIDYKNHLDQSTNVLYKNKSNFFPVSRKGKIKASLINELTFDRYELKAEYYLPDGYHDRVLIHSTHDMKPPMYELKIALRFDKKMNLYFITWIRFNVLNRLLH